MDSAAGALIAGIAALESAFRAEAAVSSDLSIGLPADGRERLLEPVRARYRGELAALKREHTRRSRLLAEEAGRSDVLRDLHPDTMPLALVHCEVRGYLRSLDAAARDAVLAQAVEHQDFVTLGAVVGAPAYLSGIEPAKQQQIVDALRGNEADSRGRELEPEREALRAAEAALDNVAREIEGALNADA